MNAAVVTTTGSEVRRPSLDVDASLAAKIAAARAQLEHVVANGMQKTGPIIQRVLTEIPEDRLVRAPGAAFEVPEQGDPRMIGATLHSHAFKQLAERAGLPTAYASKLAAGGPWERSLLQHAMREHLGHSEDKFLVRSVGGQIRGVMSDSYRRLDSRPLLESFVEAVTAVGAVPYEGVANDVRVSIRAIVPKVYEPAPGEAMVFGLSWNNSDFGAGAFGISAFAMRLICLNGAVGASELKKVHIGSRLEDLQLSQKTYDLDTRTLASATNDIVKGVLGEGAIETRVEAVRKAHETETSWSRAFAKVGKALSKSEGEKVKEAFEGSDVVMLPPGKTQWRFSNALSWIANQTDNAERKLELQQLAGAVIG